MYRFSIYRLAIVGAINMKGYLKIYVMKELSKGGKTGYELMNSVESSTGFHKPSPGTIYPLLNSLKKNGMVKISEDKNKKIYSLTKKGEEMLSALIKERKGYMNSIIEILTPIYSKEELGEVKKTLNFMDKKVKHPMCFDFGIIKKLRSTVMEFASSRRNNGENRKKFSIIIKSAIKNIRNLK